MTPMQLYRAHQARLLAATDILQNCPDDQPWSVGNVVTHATIIATSSHALGLLQGFWNGFLCGVLAACALFLLTQAFL